MELDLDVRSHGVAASLHLLVQEVFLQDGFAKIYSKNPIDSEFHFSDNLLGCGYLHFQASDLYDRFQDELLRLP